MRPPWEESLDLNDNAELHHPSRSQLPLSPKWSFNPPNKPNPKTLPSSQSFLLRHCSLPHSSSQSLTLQNVPSPSRCLIPGPAGTLQSAMLRRRSGQTDNVMESGEEPIPTQEFIRWALEDDGSAYDDDDFQCGPWLSAVDFVRRQDGDGTIGIPLTAIKNRVESLDKVAQVVAIIKSCAPNGHGDMMVTLKDPTGTINASIHRRVFAEGELGKHISLGAVLILQKVAVFSPVRSSQYLNITLDNLVKVVPKDGDALEMNDAFTTKAVAPERGELPQKQFSLSSRTERIVNSVRQAMDKQSACNWEEIGRDKGNGRGSGDGDERIKNSVVGKENFPLRQYAANGTELALGTGVDAGNSEAGFYQDQNPLSKITGSNPLGVRRASVSSGLLGNKTAIGTKQRNFQISTSSLPEWTDEQLDELFVFD